MLLKRKHSFLLFEKKLTATLWYPSRWTKTWSLTEFNWIIIENKLQKFRHKDHYQQLILLYYLKKIQEKTTIFKKCNFFGQTLWHSRYVENKVFLYNVYVFSCLKTMHWWLYRLHEKEWATPKLSTVRLFWKVQPWQSLFLLKKF